MTQTVDHPHVEGIRRVFAAFRGGDKRALYEVIAADARWTVPGSTLMSRVYAGREEVFELFRATRQLTDGSYRTELRWALADDERAVAVYRATGRRGPRALDIDQVLLIGLRGGCWQEIVAVPVDPVAFTEFWS